MLVSHEKRICFIWVPKSAGHSVQRIMLQKHGAGRWPRKARRNHEWSNRYSRGYFRFAVVRNPFTRMPSFYFWLKRQRSLRVIRPIRKHLVSFDSFLRWVPNWRVPHKKYYILQSQFLKGCRLDAVMRLETLADDLYQHGIVNSRDELFRSNIAQYPTSVEDLLTEQNCETIRTNCRQDFEQYGYSTESPVFDDATPARANSSVRMQA